MMRIFLMNYARLRSIFFYHPMKRSIISVRWRNVRHNGSLYLSWQSGKWLLWIAQAFASKREIVVTFYAHPVSFITPISVQIEFIRHSIVMCFCFIWWEFYGMSCDCFQVVALKHKQMIKVSFSEAAPKLFASRNLISNFRDFLLKTNILLLYNSNLDQSVKSLWAG